jgi:cellobiose phosphorylase
MPWFLHNGTIHLSAPRGLEQYTAAAWGTRDVCQGPVELLLPLRHFAEVREIILKLYSHQFLETGDWPQWFMFDRYHKIQAQDSHGDVIIWPLKAICDYIEASNDFSILDAQIPYTNIGDKAFTRTQHTVLHHIEHQIEAFRKACFKGTSLLKFGHGDWEDTLQPTNPLWRDLLVSSWSVELLYQTLKRWATICTRQNLKGETQSITHFTTNIKQDFTKYLMKDGIVTGLLLMSEQNKYLLHPSDKMTGAHYRLIPMTRGILSEIFTLQEAQRHVALINKHLLFPDGVRLTNVPLTYRGGLSKYFNRAETSAFFGREVGMMYIHAHLRYVEAMAKLGLAEEAWRGLAVVNPVLLSRLVKGAELRQSNMYFSSTDANFLTRAEASHNFDQVSAETIGLKGGWRLYSSGPGLFVKQLLHECIGIRDYFEYLVFDPVIPVSLGKVSVSMEYEGIKLKVIITPSCRRTATTLVKVVINGRPIAEVTEVPNPYRIGGTGILRERFLEFVKKGKTNIVEIHS